MKIKPEVDNKHSLSEITYLFKELTGNTEPTNSLFDILRDHVLVKLPAQALVDLQVKMKSKYRELYSAPSDLPGESDFENMAQSDLPEESDFEDMAQIIHPSSERLIATTLFEKQHGSDIKRNYLDFLRRDSLIKDQIRDSYLEIIASDSLGLNRDNIRITRIIPIKIYLGDGHNFVAVLSALYDFIDLFGLMVIYNSEPIISSFIQDIWAKTVGKENTEEIKKKLEKIEKALETQQIDRPKSEIDLNHANAAAALLREIGKDSKSIAMQIGNILYVGVVDEYGERHSRIHSLTVDQVEMLQQNQELLHQPVELLERLSSAGRITKAK